MPLDRAAIDRWNSRKITAPQPHTAIPPEKGGADCRTCVLSATHPVHTVPAGSNVTVLGAGRRARR